MKKYIILAILIIAGIAYLVTKNDDSNSNQVKVGDEPVIVLGDSYKTASYTIEGSIVSLDGKGTAKYFGNEARGDVNGDGTEDIAFLITNQPGGSGTFYYVVAALNADGGYVGTNAQFLGDRIAPQTTQIVDGDIVVNFADRKEGEAMTVKPSMGVTSYFKIEGGSLVYSGSR